MRPTIFADTTVQIRGVGAVLEVLAPGCGQGSIQFLGPFLVSPGEPKHPIRGQPEFTEYRAERLPRVDRVEELLPHLDGQACLRSGSSPGPLGVAVRSPAEVHLQPRCHHPRPER
jgi:hypothetical protein